MDKNIIVAIVTTILGLLGVILFAVLYHGQKKESKALVSKLEADIQVYKTSSKLSDEQVAEMTRLSNLIQHAKKSPQAYFILLFVFLVLFLLGSGSIVSSYTINHINR